jgi:hypothetical protein
MCLSPIIGGGYCIIDVFLPKSAKLTHRHNNDRAKT